MNRFLIAGLSTAIYAGMAAWIYGIYCLVQAGRNRAPHVKSAVFYRFQAVNLTERGQFFYARYQRAMLWGFALLLGAVVLATLAFQLH